MILERERFVFCFLMERGRRVVFFVNVDHFVCLFKLFIEFVTILLQFYVLVFKQ